MYRVKVLADNRVSKVQQIVNAFVKDIGSGKLKSGTKLPSVNEFSEVNNVGRDTIEKAYRRLKSIGYVASLPSRGYFVSEIRKRQLRVLLVFNKLSSFKKIIYYSLLEALGRQAVVDLQVHHYNPKLLKQIVETNFGKYDYYAIMPHFFTDADAREYVDVFKLIPADELILLDKYLPQLDVNCKAVYQDFKADIYEALLSWASLMRKYKNVTLVFPPDIHHPQEIIEGIQAFCDEQKIRFSVISKMETEKLRKSTVYIVIEEEDLANLIKKIRHSNYILGKDIGIISFNETVLKELLDISVISTDFEKMGRIAAQLILQKECEQYKNPFRVIHRGSL